MSKPTKTAKPPAAAAKKTTAAAAAAPTAPPAKKAAAPKPPKPPKPLKVGERVKWTDQRGAVQQGRYLGEETDPKGRRRALVDKAPKGRPADPARPYPSQLSRAIAS